MTDGTIDIHKAWLFVKSLLHEVVVLLNSEVVYTSNS